VTALSRARRRSASALFAVTVVAVTLVALEVGPAAARTAPDGSASVGVTMVNRWIQVGAAETLRLRIVLPDTGSDPDTGISPTLPVMLVAEHTGQHQWDRWTAHGFAVAHLQLTTDPDGCTDLNGAADTEAMVAALHYLTGSSEGFADSAGATPVGADFADGRVVAVGDETGGSPFILGAAGAKAVIGVNAVAFGYQQYRWSRSTGPDTDCPPPADVERAAPSDPGWFVRDHRPRGLAYRAATLIVQDIGAAVPTSPEQGIGVARALEAGEVPYQLMLRSPTAPDDSLTTAVMDRWLDRHVLDRAAPGAAPVLVQAEPDKLIELAAWPRPDAQPARLVGAGGALALETAGAVAAVGPRLSTEPLRTEVTLSGTPSVELSASAAAAVTLDLINADGTVIGLARGETSTPNSDDVQRVQLSPIESIAPAGSRLELRVADPTPAHRADVSVTLPVRGGRRALVAALAPEDSTATTNGPATRTAASSEPVSPQISISSVSPVQPVPTAAPTGSTSRVPPATPAIPKTVSSARDSSGSEPTTDDPETEASTGTEESTAPEDSTPVHPTVTPLTTEEPSGATPADTPPGALASSAPSPPVSTASSVAAPVATTGVAQPLPALPAWAVRGVEPKLPAVLTMSITDTDPVQIRGVSLTGTDAATTGMLKPVRVLDPGVGKWNLTGQVSDFRGPSGTILADNLGWWPRVSAQWGERTAVRPGPAAVPGQGSGLGQVRVLCSGATRDRPVVADCSGTLELGVPATARSGDYTAVLTLTLI